MKTEKDLRSELRKKGLRKRTSKVLAADAVNARALGQAVPQRTQVMIDDLQRVLQDVRRTDDVAKAPVGAPASGRASKNTTKATSGGAGSKTKRRPASRLADKARRTRRRQSPR